MASKSLVLAALVLGACAAAPQESGGRAGDSDAASEQSPPEGHAALEAWLSTGAYQRWTSEPAAHAARAGSAHSVNRIYVNDILASAVGAGDWPEGAAAVKELYASTEASEPNGFAVARKARSDSAAGANWYWYEIIDGRVVADGFGSSGPAKTICVSCHVGAPRDQIFTELKE